MSDAAASTTRMEKKEQLTKLHSEYMSLCVQKDLYRELFLTLNKSEDADRDTAQSYLDMYEKDVLDLVELNTQLYELAEELRE